MQINIYQIDAFAQKTFEGNPAAVCPLKTWLPSKLMQSIATENNLSETAFFIPNGENFEIRWFTPAVEVDLCGHATLATAHALFQHLGYDRQILEFQSRSGKLTVERTEDGYTLDFPADKIQAVSVTPIMEEVLRTKPLEAWRGKDDLMLVLAKEEDIIGLSPDYLKMRQIPTRGVIATAPGKKVDFVSRCFFPNAGINEDPVTGSAHTSLIPFWSNRLGKKELSAKQLSSRGGRLGCSILGERVKISGNCVTYLQGHLVIEP